MTAESPAPSLQERLREGIPVEPHEEMRTIRCLTLKQVERIQKERTEAADRIDADALRITELDCITDEAVCVAAIATDKLIEERERAEQAESALADWKARAERVIKERDRIGRELAEARALLLAISEWDMMDFAHDGKFWRDRITAALKAKE